MSHTPPRWRGFNLPEMFVGPGDHRWPEMIRNPRGQFVEDEFRWIRDWGFNFVRLPLCYRWWTDENSPFEISEALLAPLDSAVEWAQRYGLHLSLNLHHAPGYCINPPPRPDRFDLWRDDEAMQCFCHHWQFLARRYRATRSDTLDFDLLNEPASCTRHEYERVVRATVAAIRDVSPDRLIMIDGYNAGNEPLPEVTDLQLVQSCRGYSPSELTHYLAWWAGQSYITPGWPQQTKSEGLFGPRELRDFYTPWRNLQARGVTVFCGEFGCHHRTPHEIMLRWMEDLLDLFREMNIGWALWNFRGSFGILDSSRSDVAYETWQGLPLDRKLLELLQRF